MSKSESMNVDAMSAASKDASAVTNIINDEVLAVRHAPVGIALTTLAGELLYINDRGRELFFKAGAHIAGSDGISLTYSPDFAFMDAVARDGHTRYGKVTLHSASGAPRRVLCKATRVAGDEGVPTWLAFAAIELSELRQSAGSILDESNNMLAAQRMGNFGTWQMAVRNRANWTHSTMQWSIPMFEMRQLPEGKRIATVQAFLAAIVPEDRPAVIDAFNLMIMEGVATELHYHLIFKLGDSCPAIGRATIGPDARDPEVLRLYGVEMHLAGLVTHESLPYTKAVLMEAIATGFEGVIVGVDAENRFIYFNALFKSEMRRVTGRTPVLGESILDALEAGPFKRSVSANLKRALKGIRVVEDADIFAESSTRAVYELTYAPIRLAADMGGVVIFGINITRMVRRN